jgi:hypothetical protein
MKIDAGWPENLNKCQTNDFLEVSKLICFLKYEKHRKHVAKKIRSAPLGGMRGAAGRGEG